VPPPTAVIMPRKTTPNRVSFAPLALKAPVIAKASVPRRSKNTYLIILPKNRLLEKAAETDSPGGTIFEP